MDKKQFFYFLKSAPQEKIEELAFKSVQKRNYDFLNFLIVNKLIHNPLNTNGLSLLHFSIVCEDKKSFDLIINNRFDVNTPDDEGRTPLHYAALAEHSEYFITTLVDYNALLNSTTDNNETPLFFAVKFNKEQSCKLLLDLGADSTIPNDIGQELKYIALKNNNKSIISMLYTQTTQKFK